MDLKHPQFSYEKNRTRGARYETHYDGVDQPKADPEHPYFNTHRGFFTGSVTNDLGKEHPYALYVPSTIMPSGNSLLVFIPGGRDPKEFAEGGGFPDALEKHAVSALFLAAPEGWKEEEMGTLMDAAEKAMGRMRSNEYYYYNGPGVYAMGFEDGARAAGVFSILNASVLAAWACRGDASVDGDLLKHITGAPSDCDAGITKGEVKLPAFLITDSDSNLLAYAKKACRVNDCPLRDGEVSVFREDPLPGESYVNDPAITEVWQESPEDAEKIPFAETVEKMVSFVEGYKRWAGEGNGYIRRTQLPERIGLILKDKWIDGRLRRWRIFEPTAYKKGLKEKYPLVVAIHGFSCSGPFFAENSSWHAVAESRGFLLVYPTAYPNDPAKARNRFGGEPVNVTATPQWNSGGFRPLDPDSPDEVSFFRQMIADIEKEYPVDPERIYVTGHSNGSMMTQLLMRAWPEKFAAFAPVGAMEGARKEPEGYGDGIKRAVWYTIGEYDGAGMSLEGDNGNTRTLKMVARENGIPYSLDRAYSAGIYNHVVMTDEKGTPLVRFTGVSNWPHTYSPELSFMIYDEFFAPFRRKADGTLLYMG